jgi:hypothetical protein
MKKMFLTAAAFLLAALSFQPTLAAQSFGNQDAVGTWTFFVTIAGAPPCQCIQLAQFYSDGSLIGPANDHFSGEGLGQWKKSGYNQVTFTILQNTFNPDGSAGGLYIIKGVMTLNPAVDGGSGTSSYQLIDNSGVVLASGTATFRATKLKLDN